MAELKTTDLIKIFTSDILNSDTHDEENIKKSFTNSSAAKELLKRGGLALPKTGRYLMNLDRVLCDVPLTYEKEGVKRGWILLLTQMFKQEKIDVVITCDNFEKHAEIAFNYKI